jgi:hypothetical protein
LPRSCNAGGLNFSAKVYCRDSLLHLNFLVMEEKDVLSNWFQKEEKGHAEQLFHTRVIVQERACALTIDQAALINAVSSELVEKLELPIQPISEP